MGKCKFQRHWLCKTDELGYKISTWCRKQNDNIIFCTVCDVLVNVNKGYQAITQHVQSNRHRKNVGVKQGPLQLHLEPTVTDESSSCKPDLCISTQPDKIANVSRTVTTRNIEICSGRDSAITAEIIWTIKNVVCNMSAASCFGIVDTFKAMFPGAVEQFSLSPAKLGYIITDALGPYFRKIVIQDAHNSMYSLMFDETTNNENKKELQTVIRYWSEGEDQIVVKHLETFFLGHSTGEDLTKFLCLSLRNANLPLNRLLMIGSDGPNVNKKVARLMNEKVVESSSRNNGLLNIGFCNIHTVHNAFLKGLGQLGSDVPDVIIAIYYFFHGWPSRLEDYENIQDQEKVKRHRFIKHVPSRWLTLEPAASRLLEQWEAVKIYFLKYVPQKQAHLTSNANYSTIVRHLKDQVFKAEVQFVACTSKLFTRFTCFFQREEPLIHIMYDELKSLVLTLMGHICRAEVLKNKKLLDEDVSSLFNSDNLLPIRKVVVSDEVRIMLNAVSEKDRLQFLSNVQQHYIASCKHLLQKTPVCQTPILKHFRFLKPSERNFSSSCKDISNVARSLPFDTSFELDSLQDEWRLLQLEDIAPGNIKTSCRIDHYWRYFLNLKNCNNEKKYPNIEKVVKASLALCHGSADVERGFSKSGRVVTVDKASMSIRMLNARLLICDSLKRYNNKPELVPITRELIALARGAHASYHAYLQKKMKEKQRKEEIDKEEKEKLLKEAQHVRELESKKGCIEKLEKDLKEAKDGHSQKRETCEKLLREANNKLKKALQKNDLSEIRVAQAILESVQVVQKDEAIQRKETELMEEKLHKRKSSLITTFFNKKTKTD